jgi:hypothetical protein
VVLMTRVKRACGLKEWAQAIARRSGAGKARVEKIVPSQCPIANPPPTGTMKIISPAERSLIFRCPRRAVILVVQALAASAVVAIRSVRDPVLRVAGWALVVNESVASADIIVLSVDSGPAGALEAADLVQSGVSKRVAVFMVPPSGADYEFIRLSAGARL